MPAIVFYFVIISHFDIIIGVVVGVGFSFLLLLFWNIICFPVALNDARINEMDGWMDSLKCCAQCIHNEYIYLNLFYYIFFLLHFVGICNESGYICAFGQSLFVTYLLVNLFIYTHMYIFFSDTLASCTNCVNELIKNDIFL